MMSCNEIRDLLSMYIDNEMDESQRKTFQEHVDNCAECRKELDDILYVVNLCAGIKDVELPVNFRSELHGKLISVGKSSGETGKSFLRSKYFSILTSAAAVLVVAVLLRGFVINGIPGGKSAKTESAQYSANTAGEAQAKIMGAADSGSAQFKAADNAETSQTSIQESARSAGTSQGRVAITALGKAESLSSKNSSVNIQSDNPQEQIDKIIQLAVDNGGEKYVPQAQTTVMFSASADIASKPESVLNLKIPNSQYEAFTTQLTKTYGASNVTLSEIQQVDQMQNLNDLTNQLTDLDSKISSADNNSISTEELDKMKKEKEAVQGKIEEIRFNNDYTYVTVTIKGN